MEQNLSGVVTALPLNGSTIFVRLWWRINGKWDGNFSDHLFRGGGR